MRARASASGPRPSTTTLAGSIERSPAASAEPAANSPAPPTADRDRAEQRAGLLGPPLVVQKLGRAHERQRRGGVGGEMRAVLEGIRWFGHPSDRRSVVQPGRHVAQHAVLAAVLRVDQLEQPYRGFDVPRLGGRFRDLEEASRELDLVFEEAVTGGRLAVEAVRDAALGVERAVQPTVRGALRLRQRGDLVQRGAGPRERSDEPPVDAGVEGGVDRGGRPLGAYLPQGRERAP